jgi:hypothetical protein
MGQATKDQQSRDRMREYGARLETARESVAVLARFAQARESRGGGRALEEEFAATPLDPDAPLLPAAVWVAMRQGDVDAVIETLVQCASEQFVVAEHEQLDADYRLTTIAESLGLPDVDRLIAQVAAFVQVPRDVVAIVTGWGPDDPRTLAEIEALMDHRYGASTVEPAPTPAAASAAPSPEPRMAVGSGDRPGLAMSSSELAAVLSLTPEQQAVLGTLVRQADIVVVSDADTADG